MAITISFRKEVNVDLNRYYDAFSGSLKKQINDEMFKLLGGERKNGKSRVVGATSHMGKFKLTTKTPDKNSKVAAVMTDLRASTGKNEIIERAEIEKFGVSRGLKRTNVINNMVRGGYLTSVDGA